MNAWLLYMAQVSLSIGGIYMVYKVLLARDTFHRIKRSVVWLVLTASFVLPLCPIVVTQERAAPNPQEAVSQTLYSAESTEGGERVVAEHTEPSDGWWGWGAIYLVGAVGVGAYRMVGLARVRALVRRAVERTTCQGIEVVVVREPIAPFSWARCVVVSQSDRDERFELIFRHEQQHIKQHHEVDLMAINLIACLLWFNPFVWLLRRELIFIHECSADRGVLSGGIDAKQYQYLLISKSVGNDGFVPVVSHFCRYDLHKRIKAMNTKSSKLALLKLLVLVPLVGVGLAAFAQTEYTQPEQPVAEKQEQFCMPYQGKVVAQYGQSAGKGKLSHSGIDVVVSCDTVRAPYDGVAVVVRYSKENKGSGNTLTLAHKDGLETTYAHLEAFLLPKGGKIESGQPIAIVGNTGKSTGKHLHIECMVNGQLVDPQVVLPLNK